MVAVTDEPLADRTLADPNLARDVDSCCRLTGEFTLRSGQVASEYFDKYLFEADPVLLARVVEQMKPLVPEGTRAARRARARRRTHRCGAQRPHRPSCAVRAQEGQGVRHLQARRGPAGCRRAGHAGRGRDHHRRRGPRRHQRAARGGRDRRGGDLRRSTAAPRARTRSPTSASRSDRCSPRRSSTPPAARVVAMNEPRKPRVAVVFGGRSSEHAISCVTAGSVLAGDRPREVRRGARRHRDRTAGGCWSPATPTAADQRPASCPASTPVQLRSR